MGCGDAPARVPVGSTTATSHVAAPSPPPALSELLRRCCGSLNSILPSKFDLDERLLGTALRRAADVEGPHGELGARLADRLRSDDADRLADVDGRAAGKIAPVAGLPHTPLAASQVSTERIFNSRRTPASGRSTSTSASVDQRRRRFVNDLAAESGLSRPPPWCGRGCDSASGAITSPPSTTALHFKAVRRAAIFFGDDAVLRHVNQTARQVARVRRLQGGVGETLAGAVRRVEVLEHRSGLP